MVKKKYSRKDSTQISELISLNQDPHTILREIIGENFNNYRKEFEDAVNFKYKPAYPLHIDFEISFRCNLRCQMCIMRLPERLRKRYGDPDKKLNYDIFTRVIDEGVPLGLRSVGFNGLNEPLLENDLTRWIQYARDNGIQDIMFNTNGLLMTERISRELILSGLTRIMISIDAATPDTYRTVRGVDAFHTVVQNVKRFLSIRNNLKLRMPLVRVSFVKMKNNIHELESFIRMWDGLVDFFSIQSYGNPLVPSEEFFDVFEQFHIEAKDTDIQFRCPQPWVRLMIRQNGDINPCCGIQGPKHVVGNIYQDSINDIWNSKTMEDLRAMHRIGDYRKNRICTLCADSLHFK